jgi:hypothetical protein
MSIRKPKIDASTPLEQLKQIRSYLFQLVDELENELSQQSSGGTNFDSSKILSEVQAALITSKQAKKIAESVKDGKSAYQIAVDNGFEGTETEWLDSLQGEDGTDGEQGAMGYINAEVVDGVLYIDLNTSEEISFELNEQGELVVIYE